MKNKIIGIFLISITFLLNTLEAKWWIFGVSEDEVKINYVYLNNLSYDEIGEKVTLYKENLPDGFILIKGKASIRKGKIASVRVSINKKESWEDATLSENGAFEYKFKPELNKSYFVYIEAMDTRGKTNDIEATKKEIIVSEKNILTSIKEVLNQMVEAYKNKDANKFMEFVSEDFAGDKTNLDRAIRKDFSLFDNIDLRFTINNIASNPKGIFVSLNYNRMVISSRTGKTLTDKGSTEFVFKLKDEKPLVFSMKNPLIFGLSDASNVATGIVYQTQNQPIIVVDEKGNADTKPFNQAIKIIEGEIAVETGSFTLETNYGATVPPCPGICSGFNFEEAKEGIYPIDDVDIYMEVNLIFFNPSGGFIDLGVKSIDTVTEVPDTGYGTSGSFPIDVNIGHCFALKLANGKYAVIEIVSWQQTQNSPAIFQGTFKYKYQPDGTRFF